MIPPIPRLTVPDAAGRMLITGRRLNELLRALRARTPLDAARSGTAHLPPVPLPGYRPATTYLMPASFLHRLTQVAEGRHQTPPQEQAQTLGALPQIASTSAGLAAMLDTLHRLTPAQPSSASPLGYRLPTPEGVARLEWDIETFAASAVVCSLGASAETPGNWVLVQRQETETTLGGGYVDTVTASGLISAYGPGETPPACDEPVYDSTFDPETDYGEVSSSEYSEELLAYADLIPYAIEAVAALDATSSAHEWPMESWESASKGTPYGVTFGTVAAGASVEGAGATTARFRLRNRGSCAIRVDCGFYGSGLPGGASDVTHNVTLPRGGETDWIEPPAIDPDPTQGRSAAIRRVRLSRWLAAA